MTQNPYESPENSVTATVVTKGKSFSLWKVLAAIGVVAVLFALIFPATRSAPQAANRTWCMNNLKNITLALISYADTHKAFPPAYTVDANGNRLHSWRTLILPYLDQQALYESIDLSKPWSDPANAKAYGTELDVFMCPSAKLSKGLTTYLGNATIDGCFTGDRPRPISEITDSPDQTVLVAEVAPAQAVHWMAPQDADESILLNFVSRNKPAHNGVVNAGFVDGTVHALSVNLDSHVRRSLMTVSGNDALSAKEF